MTISDLSLSTTLNPCHLLLRSSPFLKTFSNPLRQFLPLKSKQIPRVSPFISLSLHPNPSFSRQNAWVPAQKQTLRREIRAFAGRSKKKPGGPSPGRIEGNADVRREMKRNARRKSQKLAESLFYRLKNPNRNYADNLSEDLLQEIGLGYDRMVQFMEKDDPNLRHPYDWYKYGEYGPYSWRGIVVGEPIQGRFSDERVTMISEVRDQEQWEDIEQSEMASDFGERLNQMDKSKGFKYFWVFARHPRWKISELPWQQWTLICEVVVESGEERLDKWNLMGRLGNKSRTAITKCAAWMRPDIIYVKKPVYQCRFEPQDEFFNALMPFLDPNTEEDFQIELENDDGSIEMVTYFGGLCKIVRVNPNAFVDDVVNAYEKLSDEKKSKCLEFLLTNHPVPLLHPYTREWKAKLEEEELGCDAPDDDNDRNQTATGEKTMTDWIETDNEEEEEEEEGEEEDDSIIDVEEDDGNDEELGMKEEELGGEEDMKYWEEEFEKAVNSSEAMEVEENGDETELRGKRARVKPEEWKYVGYGPWMKRIKKSKLPPWLFLRAAIRPFTYRNLVKEIVLTRHAILEGEIGKKF